MYVCMYVWYWSADTFLTAVNWPWHRVTIRMSTINLNTDWLIFWQLFISFYYCYYYFFFSFRRRKLKRIRTPAKDTGKEIPSSKNTKDGAQNRCIFFSVEVICYSWQNKAFVVHKTVWSRNFKQFLAVTKNRLKCKNRHAELLVKPKKNRNA